MELAKLTYLCLLLAANFVVIAADDCKCPETNEETNELWKFLLENEELLNRAHPVIPGELSPVVRCKECIQNNRMKRKIAEKHESGREERSPAFFRVWRHADESRNKCPLGYRRVSFMCVLYNL